MLKKPLKVASMLHGLAMISQRGIASELDHSLTASADIDLAVMN